MTGSDLTRKRLFNQRVWGKPFSTPAQVVRHLGAIQAQDYRGGLWAVGVRAGEARESTVEQALANRSIVRTWPMRGTLHLVAAEDVRWMLALLAPRVLARAAGRYRELELEPALFTRSRRLFEKALHGGGQRTRDEMYRLLDEAGIPSAGQRGIHILQRLALDGILCFGPRRGKQQTFVLLEEWIPPARLRSREEALADLALRYFNSHGPATLKDFSWWAGLSPTDARNGQEFSARQLTHASAGGEDYWGPRDGPANTKKNPAAILLPPFDEFLVAYKDRSAALERAHGRHLPSLLSPTIVVKGRIIGTWRKNSGNDGVVITPRFFDRPERGEMHSVEAAARRYGAYLGRVTVLR